MLRTIHGATGCSREDRSPAPWPLEAFPDLPEVMSGVPEARLELGRLLFYDPVLSVDEETACATCHSELWGMGDGIPRGVGHGAGLDAGPRRVGPNTLRRNSAALFNLAFRSSFLWDGAAETLDEQIEGMFRFSEMGCDDCHVPPLFESETFPNRNVPEVEGVVDDGLGERTRAGEADVGCDSARA
ncbi:MAG: cytochrome-c peroxidase [Deltaproteobacteria bacterium]|nr:cytochrome-c peroxidase [Deltaproteobacteria bacterium]